MQLFEFNNTHKTTMEVPTPPVNAGLTERTIVERYVDYKTAHMGVVGHKRVTDTSKHAKSVGRHVFRKTMRALVDAKGRVHEVLDVDVEQKSYMTTSGEVISKWADRLNAIPMLTRGIRLVNGDIVRCPDFGKTAYWAERILRVPCTVCKGSGRIGGKKCPKTVPMRTAWTADKIAYAIQLHNKRQHGDLAIDAFESTILKDGSGATLLHAAVKPSTMMYVHPWNPIAKYTCPTCNGYAGQTTTANDGKLIECMGGCMDGSVLNKVFHIGEEEVALWSAIPKQPIIRDGDVIISDYATFRTICEQMRKVEVRRGRDVIKPFVDGTFDVIYRDAMLVPANLMGQPRALLNGNAKVDMETRSQVTMAMALEYEHNLKALNAAIEAGMFIENQDPTGAIEYE